MTPETLTARSAIESLRSGVPSRHAVAQLGTTQIDIESRFNAALTATAAGEASEPIAIAANFGAGKSHLLEYLQTVAEAQGFVTSFVVVSPEMPLGNAHVVLKAVAEAAHAPGRVGKGLRTLAADPAAPSDLGPLRYWATNAGIDERFHALMLLYEQFRADEGLRSEILGDFEGKPLLKSVIKTKLREIGKLSSYALRVSPRNALIAHDRLQVLAQFFRASGGHGLVVFFDELERVAKFSVKQRIAVYQELGWWRMMAEQPGSGILPIFAMTDAFLGGSITGGTNDQQRFATSQGGASTDERDRLALRGIEILKPPFAHFLDSPTPAEETEIKHRVQTLYERAYGVPVAPLPSGRSGVRTSIRSEIRRWITQWDLQRYYPEYVARITIEDIAFDPSQTDEDVIADDDDVIADDDDVIADDDDGIFRDD